MSKPKVMRGQLVASSNSLKDSTIRRFHVQALYSSDSIGYKTKSITYKDK